MSSDTVGGTAKFDIIIVGAGPGGYVAAIRSAQLGFKTALVEKNERLGGTCLNVGCIPSKALLDSSEHYYRLRKGMSEHGIQIDGFSLDLGAMMRRKEEVVSQLTSGVGALMESNGVTVFRGLGKVVAPGRVDVTGDDTDMHIETQRIVLATGSAPMELSVATTDGEQVVTSTEALSFEAVPKRLVVIGAGAVGLELASVWARLGAEVTVVEIMDSILPGWDGQLTRTLQRSIGAQGITVLPNTRVTGCETRRDGVSFSLAGSAGEVTIDADKSIVAAGRKAIIPDEAEALGIKVASGRVAVDRRFSTSVPGIYAIGDLIEGPMLAHKAEEDAIACVEGMAGMPVHVDYRLVPNVVYTWPEVASVGATEESLKGSVDYTRGIFPFRANGRALAASDSEGFVKILADPDTDAILGAHIVGPHAATLIAELVTIMAFDGGAEDIGRIVHAHPTLSEAVREASLDALGRPLHSLARKLTRKR